jgi:tetratricopeptide (TPR) repeat protein
MDHGGTRNGTVSTGIPATLLAALVLGAIACGPPARNPDAADAARENAALRPVALPPVMGMNESVAEQMQERYAEVERERNRAPRDDQHYALAYGELGKVLLGANYLDAAEPAFINAAALDPADIRWPYYLGHLYRTRGAVRESAAQFERVLEQQPGDLPTLVWLSDAYVAAGRPDDAEPLGRRALTVDPASVAALYQAGRLSLARGDHASAVRQFEAALQRDPAATAIHYPLGLAYRAAGDMARAERHLAQRSRENQVVAPVDPLMDEVERAVTGPLALEVRGVEALNRSDWAAAVDAFRQGTTLAPRSASLHHRLGTALAMIGNADEAQREFESAVAVSPGYAKAHYSLGVLLEDRGDDEAALARYSAAVQSEPAYAQARLRLADVLRRRGRLEDALVEYDRVMRSDPSLSDAMLGRAITLVRAGRYLDARDQLIEGMKAYPDHGGFPHALARLLAAAPDDRIRDGRRALALAEQVVKTDQSTDVGETLAMALAEVGRFGQAAALQRDLIAAARQAGRTDLVARLQDNLRLYTANQPSRTPWRSEDVGEAR